MRLGRLVDLPHVGQELLQLVGRRQADLGQDAREIALGIGVVPFAAGDERPQTCMVLGRGVVAGEEPVFAADGDPLDRPFAGRPFRGPQESRRTEPPVTLFGI
jgi:hypothetical protein